MPVAAIHISPYSNDSTPRNMMTPTATAVSLAAPAAKTYTAVAVVAEAGYSTNVIAVSAVDITTPTATAQIRDAASPHIRIEGVTLFRDNGALQALGKSTTVEMEWLVFVKPCYPVTYFANALSLSPAMEIVPMRVPDKERPGCLKCNIKFTAFPPFQKRHHCRSCGDIFCQKCSTLKLTLNLPGEDYAKGPVRICDYCALYLSLGDFNTMLRYCTILKGSNADSSTLNKLQAARALHMSIEHLQIPQVSLFHQTFYQCFLTLNGVSE